MNILSFDPGLSFSGWAYSHTDDNVFTVERCGLLTPSKTVDHKENRADVELYGRRIITLSFLRSMVRDLVGQFNPDVVVSEDAFFNPRRPGAYEALVQWILTVMFVLRDEYQKPLYRIPPRIVKKYISGTGLSDKEGVKAGIQAREDVVMPDGVDPLSLVEHEGDAIAIGYTQWRLMTNP